MTVAKLRLQAFRKEQARRHVASLTKENIVGARKLAYDLRNRGVDRVADEHFAAEDAQLAASSRATREHRIGLAKEFEPKQIQNVRERIHYFTRTVDGIPQDVKVVESYHDGALVGSVETVL